jgi:hypothetical protein
MLVFYLPIIFFEAMLEAQLNEPQMNKGDDRVAFENEVLE